MSETTDKWKKLRQEMGNLISVIDGKTEKLEAEEKRMEQKRDESYLKGTEDMRKAVNMLYDASNIGLTPQKMEDLFGTYYIPSMVSRFAAIDIIDGLKLFLKEQKQDFRVGDEIEIVDPTITSNGEKRIITKVGTNSIHLVDPATFNVTWIEKEHAKKTGKHYDAVPFSKDEEKEKQEDFKPGDEVEVIKECHLDLGSKYIIMQKDCQLNTEPKIYSIMDLSNFNRTWAYANHLKKTGVVHRSLTIYFRGEENK